MRDTIPMQYTNPSRLGPSCLNDHPLWVDALHRIVPGYLYSPFPRP